ncbi:hypothetical protein ACQ4LE_002516 [Meloidogyne hapla]
MLRRSLSFGLKSRHVLRLLANRNHLNVLPSIQRNYASVGAAKKFEFQAEIDSLLDIVAKSLYSDQEVFIRELIANASDALEKRRYLEMGDKGSPLQDLPFEIRIDCDVKNRKLVFTDTGIGMNEEELVGLLGTIAKSGSKAFRSDEEKAESLIGQFGVGFYSAFVVSDKVRVTTRKVDEPTGHVWTWSGGKQFQVEEDSTTQVGTKIELWLKDSEAAKFVQAEKVADVINKYSYFISVPIFLNGERINVMSALWMMKPNETTQEMHDTLFKHLVKTHHPHLKDDRPQYTFQYQTDFPVNIRALFYVPSRRVSQFEFSADSQSETGISLYNQRVLIKPNAKELLPHFLRFLIGVVDSEDIPLNLSREMLQMDLIIEKIRNILKDRCIHFLVEQLKKDRIKYAEFYKGYSLFLKEGILTDQSNQTKEDIAQLLLFESSNTRSGITTSLSEYVERMQTDQKTIYYLYAPSRQLAETSPYFEMFNKRFEVLFITDPADELVFLSMPQFQMKQIQSVEQWVKNEGVSNVEDKNVTRDPLKKEFLTWIKDSLGSVRVSDVKPNTSQSEHPFMITISSDAGAARHMLRIADIKEMEHLVYLNPVLHVNFTHPLIQGLQKLFKKEPELAQKIAEQVYDNALISAGLLKDSSKMVGRLNKILGDLLQMNTVKSQILTP